jgi:hypothetical protein
MEVTQMVTDRNKDSAKTPVKQGPEKASPEPNKINASTPFDFTGKNLTPYGGLLPVITMLEKLDFQSLVEQTVTWRSRRGSGFRVSTRRRSWEP